jgi:thiosulfate dehydrogenase [quinone] large subunit
MTSTAAKALAVLRVSTGFVFLWAFLDKTCGLHYATPSAKIWFNGGSPTRGFLASVEIGPFQSLLEAAGVTARMCRTAPAFRTLEWALP